MQGDDVAMGMLPVGGGFQLGGYEVRAVTQVHGMRSGHHDFRRSLEDKTMLCPGMGEEQPGDADVSWLGGGGGGGGWVLQD